MGDVATAGKPQVRAERLRHSTNQEVRYVIVLTFFSLRMGLGIVCNYSALH